MEKSELLAFEQRCSQEEPPRCQAACPLRLDARGFLAAFADQGAPAARLVLERTLPLAGLVAHLCEAPCEAACLRGELGGALAVGELERTCVTAAPRRNRPLLPPAKAKRAAVLGAGAGGLVAAWDLVRKGWRVTLHFPEKTAGLPLSRHARSLPAPVLAEELELLASLGVVFAPETSPDPAVLAGLIREHDGAFLDLAAWGPGAAAALGGDPAGRDPLTLALGPAGVFAGGLAESGRPPRFIDAAGEGRRAATSLDRWLRGVSLTAERAPEGPRPTRLATDTRGVAPAPRLAPADPGRGFTPGEAAREATRCLRCECRQCVAACLYLQESKSYPKALARRFYNNEAIVKGSHDANLLVNSCSLCGQCREICPHDFAMAELCRGARERMVARGLMPPSAHHLALAEMNQALGPEAFLARPAPGAVTSQWLFFPGCQLAGLRPAQVAAVYADLRSRLPGGVALVLGCCGAPAHWAGRREEAAAALARFKAAWRELDCPRVITACASCQARFAEAAPELAATTLWELWRERGAPPGPDRSTAPPLAISDPCSAREDPAAQGAVRSLLAGLGQRIEELALAGRLTECCGYGGLMAEANPELAGRVVARRAAQSGRDYLAYCAMCRDRLAAAGKRVIHLLDLYFPPADAADPAALPPVGLSARWQNRVRLRRELAAGLWGEAPGPEAPWADLALAIPPEVMAALEERRILVDDLKRVIHAAEAAGRDFLDPARGVLLVEGRLGPVTFWAEYERRGGTLWLRRAWSHRMTPARTQCT